MNHLQPEALYFFSYKLLKYRKLRNYGNLFFFNHAPLSVKSYAITKYIIVIILKFFSIQAVLQMNLQNIIHRTRQLQEYILNVILIYATVRTAVQNLYNGLKTDMIILQISTMLSEVLLTELNIPTGNRLRKKRKKVRH